MGNNLSLCCCESLDDDNSRLCCAGRRRGRMRGGKMVPADLHSSSAQDRSEGQSRPKSLPTPITSAASASEVCTKPKIAEFSLHGVQKTSPIEHSDEIPEMYRDGAETGLVTDDISAFFEKYKDGNSDEILAEGIVKFCNDLGVDPAEYIVLALAWKFKAATMCKFTRDEFVQGCLTLEVNSITSLKNSFPRLEQESIKNFKDVYKYAFQFGLDSDIGQRSLPTDVAVGMWQVIFSNNAPFLLEDWLKFLEENQVRGISRDTWNMFLHFTESIGSDMSSYDDSEAWPSLFDDFVEYYRSKKDELADEPWERCSDREQIEHMEMQLLPEEQSECLKSCHPTQDTCVSGESRHPSLETSGSVADEENSKAAPTLPDFGTSKNSTIHRISAPEEHSLEIDSVPICCETLHSSHFST